MGTIYRVGPGAVGPTGDTGLPRHERPRIAARTARVSQWTARPQRVRFQPTGRHAESCPLMTVTILRSLDGWWVQTSSGAAKIDTAASTTAELLADRTAIDTAAGSSDAVPVNSLTLVSPVTTPCRVVAQMTNYASHVKDA